MCIVAIANALQVNLAIFEKVNEEAILINHQCTTAITNKTMYLKYSHDPEGKHLGDHYDAIVNIEIPVKGDNLKRKEKETNGQQSEERSEVQECQMNTKKTTLQNQNRMNMEKNVIHVVTDQIPWEVDGTSIYQIQCDEEV